MFQAEPTCLQSPTDSIVVADAGDNAGAHALNSDSLSFLVDDFFPEKHQLCRFEQGHSIVKDKLHEMCLLTLLKNNDSDNDIFL